MAQADYGWQNINTNATTVIRSGVGVFQGLTINAAGTTWVVAMYDDISAVAAHRIGTITGPVAGGQYLYNCELTNGLCIVTSGTTPGDLTVEWA